MNNQSRIWGAPQPHSDPRIPVASVYTNAHTNQTKHLIAGFDWDAGNWPKCGKHGVAQAEIEDVIENARFMVDDPSPTEKRFRTAGKALTGRHVLMVRERKGKTFLRPISLRSMHEKEIKSYEAQMAGAPL